MAAQDTLVTAAPSDAYRILVVDDDPWNRELIARMLHKEQYGVEMAEDGQAALELIRSQHFDLVLLDNMMPGLSGVEVLKRVRGIYSTSELPVIMVTAQNDSGTVVSALDCGANDYIGKPIDAAIITARIRAQLARKQAEQALRSSEERYALAVRGANDGLWDWNLETGRVYYSPRWKEMLGCDGEVTDSPAEWSDRLHPGDRAMFLKRFDDHCRGLSEGLNVECRMRHHEGHYRWFLSRGLAVRGPNGVAMRIAGSLTDVTQGKTTDPLTNLPNRLRLEEKLEEALEHAQRDGGNFAVLFIDLDRFKIVNDSLGHLAGDIMIREVARRLEAGIRTRDDTVARFGGDEFGVVLDRLENRDDAEIVARRIQELIAQPLLLSGQKLFPSASIGVAIGGPTSIAEDVLRNADTAMYHAKALGKGTFSVFQDQMRERAISRMEIECDMRTALEKQQFEAFFQPKVELRTGQLRGFEALARWRHPTRGMVSPAEFIPIAEDAELIAELGERILRLACERLAAWEKSYPIDPPLLMSVNLSTRELTAGDVVGRIRRVIEETGVQSEHVSMELTESAMAQNSDAAESLARLKALGLGLKVDDFGTGYSSLSYLHSFPFDTLKIDQSFVRRLTLDRETPEIVRTIIVLAQSLGLGVVAEGVETEEQRQKLLQLGCEYAQGFLFSRPVDAASAEALVKARFEAQVKV